MVQNQWKLVNARGLRTRGLGAGGRFVDPPFTDRAVYPSGRRGHTMGIVRGYVYLFGGYETGYDCEQGMSSTCIHRAGVTNELWRYDPLTETWIEIERVGVWPSAREMHSAVVLSNRLVVFGGRDGNVNALNGT